MPKGGATSTALLGSIPFIHTGRTSVAVEAGSRTDQTGVMKQYPRTAGIRCNGTAAEQKDEAEPAGDSLHYKATQNHSCFEGVVSGETWPTAGFDAGNSA